MGDKLSNGQAQNAVKFDFQVKFDLEDQGWSTRKTIGTSTKFFTPYLVFLAWTSGELSCGQALDWNNKIDSVQTTTNAKKTNYISNICPAH